MIKNSEIYKNNQSTALRNQAVKKLQKININDLKDQYKTINQSFSKFVTISGYETKYIDDSKEILILTYQEVPFATYINEGWPGTFESPRNEGTLKNLTGKKVSVLVPPFDMFAQTYVASEKEVGNKPIFYAKTEFDEYDLEWSLEQYELTKASKVLTKEVSINPENNLKNLYLLNDYSQDIDKLSSFDDKGVYASKRQKELCEFFSQPKTVLSVGYIKSNDEWGHPFDNYYVTVSGLPNSQIFIDTPSGLLQKIGAGPSDADINKGLLWLKGIVTKFNPEIDLQNICNESFSLNFSDYEHSIFEKDYPIPILERFWVAHAFMRKVSQQEVGVWGQLWKQGWNPLTQ